MAGVAAGPRQRHGRYKVLAACPVISFQRLAESSSPILSSRCILTTQCNGEMLDSLPSELLRAVFTQVCMYVRSSGWSVANLLLGANKDSPSGTVRALLRNQNQFLSKSNNEAKARRSTKSSVVRKAKVMSYEDIVKVKEGRAAKEAAAVGRRGRKRDRGRCARAKRQSGADERSAGCGK